MGVIKTLFLSELSLKEQFCIHTWMFTSGIDPSKVQTTAQFNSNYKKTFTSDEIISSECDPLDYCLIQMHSDELIVR